MDFNPIYEIRLAGRDIKINRDIWDNIRDHVRDNRWFYVEHMDVKYRFVKDQGFYDRPTRFDFEPVPENWDDTPDIIRI